MAARLSLRDTDNTGSRLFLVLAALASITLTQLLPGASPGPESQTESPAEQLICKPRTAVSDLKPIAVGDSVETKANERRRVALPDGSMLFVNQNTKAKLDADRQLTLAAGEVFVEVASAKKDAPFKVKTAKREVTGPGGKFAVNASDKGTGVVVTSGKVSVSGLKDTVMAGQQLRPDKDKASLAPRASHLLDWTRDLLASAESPLVPGSSHAGGSLVAVDPDGQQMKLELRKYAVDVHVEDGFARTTIDQTYFNHETQRLEGTFYFPLPADASLSRLAMYVDGNLMEGGMVERDYARNVYETIVHQQKDPALLEWVDGSTFKMRVFPLEGRQEKRIILSYTQKLAALHGRAEYRFPAGHTLGAVRDWSFTARVKNGAELAWNSPSHTLRESKDGNDRLLSATEKNAKLDRDVVLMIDGPNTGILPGPAPAPAPDAPKPPPARDYTSFEHEGHVYFMVRHRWEQIDNGAAPAPPPPPGSDPVPAPSPKPELRTWVFLFESSGDRDPLLARTQVEIIRGMLHHAGPEDTFAVLSANTRVKKLDERDALRPVNSENIQAALSFLESSHLIGALDLSKAFAQAEPILKAAKNPYLVHVGSGIPAMGERRTDALANVLPKGTRYVGVGVGKRWNPVGVNSSFGMGSHQPASSRTRPDTVWPCVVSGDAVPGQVRS